MLAQLPPGYSDEEGSDDEDTLGVEEDEPLTNPDTTQTAPPPATPAPADTMGPAPMVAPADTASTTAPDTLPSNILPVAPDSAAAAARRAAAADSGIGDTLFMAKPRPQGPQQPGTTPAPAKKPRNGIFGIHPIAILVGLVALHYFVTKATGD